MTRGCNAAGAAPQCQQMLARCGPTAHMGGVAGRESLPQPRQARPGRSMGAQPMKAEAARHRRSDTTLFRRVCI